MHYRIILSLTILLYLTSTKVFASDTTSLKKPIFLSVSVGYVKNNVYGSRVDKNKESDEAIQQENNKSYAVNFQLQKQFTSELYLRTGISFIKKQVDPQENTNVYYRDRLKTYYLSVPLTAGVNVPLTGNEKLGLGLEFGPAVNLRLSDKSYVGPDRVSSNTSFATLSLNPGASLDYKLSTNTKLTLGYTYMLDITDAYIERVYWNNHYPRRKFAYKNKTQMLSLGLQWAVR